MLEEKAGTGANARKYLAKITTATNRMQNLIRDMLTYSELSRRAPAYEPVDLQQTVRDAVTEFELPPVISITCNREDQSFHLKVRDNGIGFSPEHADQIFSILKRLHRKDQYSGTGIGLAMCKKIVENHGGGITATGSPGEGAAFHLVLPAHHR
jgi:light-regulated signal transduction histidine kinase (bacteriophytochrome)